MARTCNSAFGIGARRARWLGLCCPAKSPTSWRRPSGICSTTRCWIEIVRSRADLPTIRRYLESSLPVHLRASYLGNSTCIEIETPGELIVVDCGTGFRDLGYDLERRWNTPGFAGSRQADILITHPHIDHIAAIPFVGSFYDPRNRLHDLGAAIGAR